MYIKNLDNSSGALLQFSFPRHTLPPPKKMETIVSIAREKCALVFETILKKNFRQFFVSTSPVLSKNCNFKIVKFYNYKNSHNAATIV
jgi:hypothetical protein